jgi:hypothetical protein
LKKAGESQARARASYVKIDQGTRSPHGKTGGLLGRFGRCPFLPSLILNLHLRHLNMSGAISFAGAHHFVARSNTFIEAQTVSGMFTKVSVEQANGVGCVTGQHPQQVWK